jgi:peroxiredoxin Q/BCP
MAKKKTKKARAPKKSIRAARRAPNEKPAAAKKRAPKKAARRSAKTKSEKKPARAPKTTPANGDSLVGKRAPGFELPDQDGRVQSSRDLAGAPYVLYFYPKDDTPGCTREACDFRDGVGAFRTAKVRVLGVSPDSSSSHGRFQKKYSLPFTLLSDADKKLANAYGTWVKKQNYGREYMGISRSTFLVDAKGVVRRAWRGVKVDGHVEKVLAAARELG